MQRKGSNFGRRSKVISVSCCVLLLFHAMKLFQIILLSNLKLLAPTIQQDRTVNNRDLLLPLKKKPYKYYDLKYSEAKCMRRVDSAGSGSEPQISD